MTANTQFFKIRQGEHKRRLEEIRRKIGFRLCGEKEVLGKTQPAWLGTIKELNHRSGRKTAQNGGG